MHNKVVTKNTEVKQRATLKRLEKFSRFMDSSIGIPFTKFKLGAESVIGMLPVVGDFAGFVFSSYVLVEAQRAGATRELKIRILGNMLIDFFGGLIPVIGDVFDVIFKANTRNTGLLKNYLEEQLAIEPPSSFPWRTLIGLLFLFSIVAGGITLLI